MCGSSERSTGGSSSASLVSSSPAVGDIDHDGSLEIHGEGRESPGLGVVFEDPEIVPSEWTPRLSILSLDIETDPTARRLLAASLHGCGVSEVLLLCPPASLQAENELLKVHQMQLLEKEHSGCAALLVSSSAVGVRAAAVHIARIVGGEHAHAGLGILGAHRRLPVLHGDPVRSGKRTEIGIKAPVLLHDHHDVLDLVDALGRW